jgi:hypothetical protein
MSEIIREIATWANGQDERRIFWLKGIAGIGRSKIACDFYEQRQLGASFFFSIVVEILVTLANTIASRSVCNYPRY